MVIKGRGFVLRHLKMADAGALLECRQDAESLRNFMSTIDSLGDMKKWIRGKMDEYGKSKPSEEVFVIEVDGKAAGFIDVHDLNKEYFEHRAMTGFGLHPDFRGRGLMTRALKLFVPYVFKKYKLKRFEGWCRTFNKASARVLEKAGFKLEGVLRKNKCKDGEYLDDMIWAVVR